MENHPKKEGIEGKNLPFHFIKKKLSKSAPKLRACEDSQQHTHTHTQACCSTVLLLYTMKACTIVQRLKKGEGTLVNFT